MNAATCADGCRGGRGRKRTAFAVRKRVRAPSRAPLALALMAALGLGPTLAPAATISVTSPGDTNPAATTTCTLRQAIESMNAGATQGNCVNSAPSAFGTDDTIVFDASQFPQGGANVITLADTADNHLDITAAKLSIDATANSHVTIERGAAASNDFRILYDHAPAGGSLTLSHLTVRNGKVTASWCRNFPRGGGICIPDADLTLANSRVSGNTAPDAAGVLAYGGSVTLINSTVSGNSAGRWGGAIYSNRGDVSLTNSTVSGNSASSGAGIYAWYASVTLSNSTVSGNSALYFGGGIHAKGKGITLTNSTLSANSAGLSGGSIGTPNSSVSANNSIISGNTGGDIDGATASGANNLIGNVPNLKLGPLHDNRGPTRTMLPLQGSAAIDAVPLASCSLATDQRGVARPYGAACDIGAVEVDGIIFADGFDP